MKDEKHSDQGNKTSLEELDDETTSYPIRPGDPDCIYYLRTGFCGYGDRCRFNHPNHRSTSLVPDDGPRMGGESYPNRSEQPICQHFMRTGSCKFGSSCKYQHPRHGAGSIASIGVNIYGYPMRPGEKECTYYMKMGQCKFGMTCKFDHPQPSNVPMSAIVTPAPQHYGVVAGDWPVVRPSMMSSPHFQVPYGPMLFSPGVVPFHGWAAYPAPNNLVTTPINPSTVGAGQLYGLTQLSPSAPPYTGTYQVLPSASPSSIVLKEQPFPQRQGKPDCQYYLRTGECKFGSSCRYHHPEEWVAPDSNSALNSLGLPLRPGTPTCSYYTLHGVCKYGPACKFDHPIGGTLSYTPSVSSLSDMPVAPYPVRTLAASSSLSDLQAELVSGPTKESEPPLTSSLGLSSESGGSVQSISGTETTDHGGAPT